MHLLRMFLSRFAGVMALLALVVLGKADAMPFADLVDVHDGTQQLAYAGPSCDEGWDYPFPPISPE